jgi:DNA repair exonuclease SbcCD ATPase subunit
LGMILKKVLWKISRVTVIDCQFIDEGFGCCDENNIDNVIQYLLQQFQKDEADDWEKNPRFIFVVSHIEKLKNSIQKIISIKTEKENSQINFI